MAHLQIVERMKKNPILVGGGGAVVAVAGAAYLFLRSQSVDINKDLYFGFKIARTRRLLQSIYDKPEWTLVDFWNETVAQHANSEAIVFVDTNTSYTFKQVDEISNKGLPLSFLPSPLLISPSHVHKKSPTGPSLRASRRVTPWPF